MSLTVGSLFSGIGGLDLGLERAGMTVRWQSEIDPYACRVLAKHWPNTPNHGDVTTIDWSTVEPVDLICAGWPCQDLSHAGARAGIDGKRSGLWVHVAAALRSLRPRYVLLENVPGLLVRGMGEVLADLARLGYDTEWHCIPAAAVGAPHLRARVWILAYPGCVRDGLAPWVVRPGWLGSVDGDRWASEPGVGRVAARVPHRVDRLRALGNSAVPAVAEHLGRLILSAHSEVAA